jgi:N-acyl-D-aspartate/D-glutamate deacylase
VRDNATYDNPHQFASGFECVIVNGKIAVREDEFTGVRNGMVIKKTE